MTVAMIADVLGGHKTLRIRVENEPDLRELTRKGLPVDAVANIANELRLPVQEITRVAGISGRTLSRRMTTKARLTPHESDRLVRMAREVAFATEVLGSAESAAKWMQFPNRALEGERPMDLLDTEAGARMVNNIIGRIAYGLFS